MTQNFKSIPKITYAFFFETLFYPIHPRSSSYSRKCHYFFPKIMFLPYHPHLPPNIYNFVIDINTSTTMNYQIESVNTQKFQFFFILSHFLSTQTVEMRWVQFIRRHKGLRNWRGMKLRRFGRVWDRPGRTVRTHQGRTKPRPKVKVT